jgi:uncharacterized metal-binding protein YceD (DUF177 family)
MRIRIEDLPEEGLYVDADLGEPWVASAVGQAWEGEAREGHVHFHVNRVMEDSPTIRVRGKADAAVERDCDRCGTSLRFEHAGPVDLYFVPEGKAENGSSAELHRDDLDIGWYDGHELDLGDVLMEQLSLWLPGRLTCEDQGATPLVDDLAHHVCQLPAQQPIDDDVVPMSPFAGLRLPK